MWQPLLTLLLLLLHRGSPPHRDSLGALAGAIKEFGGGVVIISHHNEFTTALCPEKWTVADGKCVVTGAPQVSAELWQGFGGGGLAVVLVFVQG